MHLPLLTEYWSEQIPHTGPSLPAAHFPPPTQAAGGHLYTCARSTPSFSSSCPSCSASERRAFALRVWAKGLIQKPLSVTGLSLPSHVAPYSQGRHSRPAATSVSCLVTSRVALDAGTSEYVPGGQATHASCDPSSE